MSSSFVRAAVSSVFVRQSGSLIARGEVAMGSCSDACNIHVTVGASALFISCHIDFPSTSAGSPTSVSASARGRSPSRCSLFAAVRAWHDRSRYTPLNSSHHSAVSSPQVHLLPLLHAALCHGQPIPHGRHNVLSIVWITACGRLLALAPPPLTFCPAFRFR